MVDGFVWQDFRMALVLAIVYECVVLDVGQFCISFIHKTQMANGLKTCNVERRFVLEYYVYVHGNGRMYKVFHGHRSCWNVLFPVEK